MIKSVHSMAGLPWIAAMAFFNAGDGCHHTEPAIANSLQRSPQARLCRIKSLSGNMLFFYITCPCF
ncbi:hypothetical protein ACFFW8_04890 [Erwinia tracheiphila]|uniref:hypothetical protein n=1 Tax=Erwinia tracheiphila TaxID=65700 RepID=UPI001F429C98|nr:hypothetical protein [Erwinia tracheiphila]UIA94375.1 hypothetical protein LU632_24490 [Erwinia tracheiphila]